MQVFFGLFYMPALSVTPCVYIPTSQSPRPLDGLVDTLEAGQQCIVVVGADLVLVDQVSVHVVQLPIALLHGDPGGAEERTQIKTGRHGGRKSKQLGNDTSAVGATKSLNTNYTKTPKINIDTPWRERRL